ncbi:hypothetical protein HYH03_014520 [Edaphochlamys debaryana]|uniref:Protein kinase domain-containing protein n=1 Tax=Edaphochlamys debaryana TaxID=47281 RepID=A0A836BS69_9CHLO|nr:hypothetical protein HYH03_014520 [Edaphochlamys debaryana]|eukprot:KAG2486837.1 hypothetical protein HYH03_014520 [Edaphochlamys debaryana]
MGAPLASGFLSSPGPSGGLLQLSQPLPALAEPFSADSPRRSLGSSGDDTAALADNGIALATLTTTHSSLSSPMLALLGDVDQLQPADPDMAPGLWTGAPTIREGDWLLASSPVGARTWDTPAHAALGSLRGLVRGGRVMVTLMEYCRLGNLQHAACARPSPFLASPSRPLRLAQRSLLRTAKEMATGLAALHAAGLAHGALRPSNVLLAASLADERGFVARLADAGSGSLEAAAAFPLRLRPSSAAMLVVAPEALTTADAVHKPAADVRLGQVVYALGVLMYLMAAGEMPFSGRALVPVLMGVASGGLSPHWPAGPHDHLAPLFAACVQPQPAQRPSAQAVRKRGRGMD